MSARYILPQHFQFTTSQGGRLRSAGWMLSNISTFNSRPHKEVDIFGKDRDSSRIPFNSRPHKEVDLAGPEVLPCRGLSIHDLTRRSTTFLGQVTTQPVFQFPTSPGGRRLCGDTPGRRIPFNSRPHKEVDRTPTGQAELPKHLSIHDLTRRSTGG